MTTSPSSGATPSGGTPLEPWAALTRKHLRLGWCCLALFAILGLVLESLHALKSGYYLNVSNETRRLLWRLSHAHGALLALVNIAFAVALPHLKDPGGSWARLASLALASALFLLPAGFFLGGIVVHGADPNPAIALVPVGALAFVFGLIAVARRT